MSTHTGLQRILEEIHFSEEIIHAQRAQIIYNSSMVKKNFKKITPPQQNLVNIA